MREFTLPPPGHYLPRPVARNMDRWLGNGGMEIIDLIGGSIDSYGEGWCEGAWAPTAVACNTGGEVVQAGVTGILLDGLMNFAINAGLGDGARTRATLEMKSEYMKPARHGERYTLRGEVVRMAKQVAYAEAQVRAENGDLHCRATATFILHRPD